MTNPLEKITVHPVDLEEKGTIHSYKINLGSLVIGGAHIALDKNEQRIAIDDLWLDDKDMRGKGYGRRARVMLLGSIIDNYEWAHTISSTISLASGLRTALAAPAPPGWQREFTLCSVGNESEVTPQFVTKNPLDALDWIESKGPVSVTYRKV